MTIPKHVKAVLRAVDVLRVLTEEPKGVVEISRTLNMGQATVHRLLNTLEFAGMVIQDNSDRKYSPGPMFWKAASDPHLMYQSLVTCAHDEMKRLQEATGETVGMYVQFGARRLLVGGVESRQRIKYVVERGYEAPIYTGAPGRVLLSSLTTTELEKLLNEIELPLVGPTWVTSKTALMAEVRKTRERGYAKSSGEWAPGATAISVPVKKHSCPVALSVFGPSFRIVEPDRFLQDLLEAANRISVRLRDTHRSRSANRRSGG